MGLSKLQHCRTATLLSGVRAITATSCTTSCHTLRRFSWIRAQSGLLNDRRRRITTWAVLTPKSKEKQPARLLRNCHSLGTSWCGKGGNEKENDGGNGQDRYRSTTQPFGSGASAPSASLFLFPRCLRSCQRAYGLGVHPRLLLGKEGAYTNKKESHASDVDIAILRIRSPPRNQYRGGGGDSWRDSQLVSAKIIGLRLLSIVRFFPAWPFLRAHGTSWHAAASGIFHCAAGENSPLPMCLAKSSLMCNRLCDIFLPWCNRKEGELFPA